MRIALDCRIAHYTTGGTAVYARRLAQALAPAAGDSLLLLEAARAATPLPASGAVQRARLLTPSHHRLEQLTLPLELLPRRIDVLHSTDFIPPFVRRCRSVITIHDLAFLRYPEFLTAESRRYFNGQIERAVRSTDRIIAVSQATRQDLIELLGVAEHKIDVVYEAPAFDAEPQPARSDEDYILFAGTLEPRKNLPLLIRAFAGLRRRGYAGKLVLAGAVGWLAQPVFEEIERQGLDQHVALRALSPDLYQGARLLALPSLYEGFGLPVLEAMACGTPVVTSNVSSLPEIAGDAALLVDPADETALADAMWHILTNGALRNELRSKGLARAAEFSWKRAAKETLAVYHQLG